MARTSTADQAGPSAFGIRVEPPNYQYDDELAAQLRNDKRERPLVDEAGVAEAIGDQGTFIDNGWDRWHFMILPGTPGVLTLQLQVADHITWWKHIEVSASFFGSWFRIRTLGTVNDTKTAAVDLTSTDAQSGTLRLEFWKAGFLNTASYITTQLLDVPSHLGQRVVFLCSRDHPDQP